MKYFYISNYNLQSVTSITTLSSDKVVSKILHCSGKSSKKSFMYFSSSVGKGFIISDDEEVTGVISVRNKVLLVRNVRAPEF